MKKIDIGEYIRTINGKIIKVKLINSTPYTHLSANAINKKLDINMQPGEKRIVYNGCVDEHYVLKHNTDLLKVLLDGDLLIVEFSEEWVEKQDKIRLIMIGGNGIKIEYIRKAMENGLYKIKKIITKEQLDSKSYEIEE